MSVAVASGGGEHDLLVVGAGISGLALAHFAQAQGRRVTVLEASPRVGGALHSARWGDDFWLELGGHTGYNSYGRLLGIVDALGLGGRLLRRETARWMLWREGRAVSVPSQLSWLALAAALPRGLMARKAGARVADYYGRLLGRGNWERVGRAMLSAVVSQDVDDFPADVLFKKRPRRKELPRSYAVQGGLQSVAEAIAGQTGLAVLTDAAVARVERVGAGWRITCASGAVHTARTLGLAAGPQAVAALLPEAAPGVATVTARLDTQRIESEGVVLRAERCRLPRMAGLVGGDAPFRSVVSRDPVAHAQWRGFAFHFRPGTPTDVRDAQIAAVLGCTRADLELRITAAHTLPAPRLGHGGIVAQLDATLAGQPLLVTGNWFGGLAIEDCVARSWSEAQRLAEMG